MSAFNQDPTLADMQAYIDNPSLLSQGANQAPPPSEPAAAETSTAAAGQDFSFGDLGLDAQAQLLEAILAELRTLNQTIRELT